MGGTSLLQRVAHANPILQKKNQTKIIIVGFDH